MASTTRRRTSQLKDEPDTPPMPGSLSASEKPTQQSPDASSRSIPLTVLRKSISGLLSTFRTLSSSSPYYVPSSPYSTILHARPWIFYRGTSTYVPISVLGSKPLAKDRQIVLQKRGWRTGLLGWTVGSWLGGLGSSKMVDVTPENDREWFAVAEPSRVTEETESQVPSVSQKTKDSFDKEIEQFLNSLNAPKDHAVLETDLVRIPISSGDGYFRLAIHQNSSSSPFHAPLAYTSTFRLGSLSLSSSQPRGASPVTLVPEVILRSASVAVWAGFWTMFPILKVAEMIPGPTSVWGRWAIDRAWKSLGGQQNIQQIKEKVQFEQRKEKIGEQVYSQVPFGAAGVRTEYDLKRDMLLGRGGVHFYRHGS